MVNGVGYRLYVPLSTYQMLPQVSEPVTLATYLHVKENSLSLVGFATESERDLFELMIAVSGIGLRLALTILSGVSVEDLLRSLVDEDEKVLSRISGVGPKTARRVILELKEKAVKISSLAPSMTRQPLDEHLEAILALEALGYNRLEAKRAVETAAKELGAGANSEELIKTALQVSA
jgi:Holliday junction DNA helicase RuvA